MDEVPFMYTDLGEVGLIKWTLDYTMDWVIGTFESIPESCLFGRPRPNINAPAWIFGHIAVTERSHVAGFIQGNCSDIPEGWGPIFKGHGPPDEEDLKGAAKSRAHLISSWRGVRQQTHEYLDAISDADLKEEPKTSVLGENDPNRRNPVREFFVMTIQHQNHHWGQLSIVQKLLEGEA